MTRSVSAIRPYCLFLGFLSLVPVQAVASEPAVSAGPMVGHGTHHDVAIWVRTTQKTMVQVRYWPGARESDARTTPVQITKGQDERLAQINIRGLKPGTVYRYQLLLGDPPGKPVKFGYPLTFQTQALWRGYKSRGPPEFVVALGSCAYTNDAEYEPPGKAYGGGYEIYETIRKHGPDLMLWLGDNVYFRRTDWGSRAGLFRRYSRDRALPALQALLGSTHHYAIWDDHDYGPNDADRSYVLKGASLDAFRSYWANPSYGLPDLPGVFTQFTWADVDFFLLDNRYYRSPSKAPRTAKKTQFGKRQLQWLVDALTASKAPFKIVAAGGQFLSPFDRWEGSAQFPHEQRWLIDTLIERQITGVLFVSGDRHHTELVKINPKGFYPLYDFTSSPLTSRGASADGEWNSPVRVPGTLVTKKRNFGILRFGGPAQDRVLTLETRDAENRLLWTHTIRAESLRASRASGK